MNKPTIKYPTAQPTERIGFISLVFCHPHPFQKSRKTINNTNGKLTILNSPMN